MKLKFLTLLVLLALIPASAHAQGATGFHGVCGTYSLNYYGVGGKNGGQRSIGTVSFTQHNIDYPPQACPNTLLNNYTYGYNIVTISGTEQTNMSLAPPLVICSEVVTGYMTGEDWWGQVYPWIPSSIRWTAKLTLHQINPYGCRGRFNVINGVHLPLHALGVPYALDAPYPNDYFTFTNDPNWPQAAFNGWMIWQGPYQADPH